MVTAEQIKQLRERTDVSMMVCKRVLEQAGGDMEKALEILRKEGAMTAQKKSARALNAGIVDSYIHSTKKVGVLIEARSETDFVARNEDFLKFVRDVAMHITASNPLYVSEQEAEGKQCEKTDILLNQPYIKNPSITIGDYIKEAVQKFGENIEIARFARFDA